MPNIVITARTAGKSVLIDFGDLYDNPSYPFIDAKKDIYVKGGAWELELKPTRVIVKTSKGGDYDLTPAMVDTIGGVTITTVDQLFDELANIIEANLA